MECLNCHTTFPAGSKFCGFCGQPLALVAAAIAPPPLPRAVEPQPVAPPPPKVESPASPASVSQLFAAPTVSSWESPQPVSPAAAAFPPGPPVTRSQPQTISPPAARPAQPVRAPSAASLDTTMPASLQAGTLLFDGFRVPSIEAHISEKKTDGTWGHPLQIVGGVSIGRANCEINFPDDARLSDRHALLSNREGKLYLADFGSLGGTFIKQRQDTELLPGDVFLLGQDLFRFTTQSLEQVEKPSSGQGTMMWASPPKLHPGPVSAKLEHILVSGEVIEEFELENPETTLGRTNANLVFKDDHYMSGTHARIVAQPGRFILQDLRSRNGVFRQVRSEIELEAGDEFFLGEHIFRVEIKQLN
jgi:pSer/pThr/pTyr-binding forkhead associated (FHA) protein